MQFLLNGNSLFTLRVIVWSNSCSDVLSAFKVAIRIIIHDGIFFFDSEINKNNFNKGVYALKNGCERTKWSGGKRIIVLKAD